MGDEFVVLGTLDKEVVHEAVDTAALAVSFPALDGLEICCVEIPAGTEETFVSVTDRGSQKRGALYVHMGNKAEEIPREREMTKDVRAHWA